MRDKTLNIGRGVKLSLDMATEALGVIATRGAGKTYTSAVLIEEMFKCSIQLCVIDPMGVYWGLRAGADGDKKGGLPMIVLGGPHGDAPLEPTAGALIADLLVDTGQSLVLDVSEWSKGEQSRFVKEFADKLFQAKATERGVLHVVIDEADEFAPERPMRDESFTLAAVARLVKRGRTRGIGVTLISQRTQAISKSVLDLIETLFVMRMLSPRSHKAVEGWITAKEERDELGIVASLPHLPTGTGWLWSPMRGVLQKVTVRKIKTFDSYRTPKPGEVSAEPREVVEIDLTKLGKQIAATVERAKENDPKALRAEIKRLRAELAERPSETVEVEKVVEIEKQVLGDADFNKLARLVQEFRGLTEPVERFIREAGKTVDPIIDKLEALRTAPPPPPKRPAAARPVSPPRVDGRRTTAKSPREGMDAERQVGGDASLSRAERLILSVLAQHPEGRTTKQVAIATGYSHKGGGFRNALGALRSAGLISGRERVTITEQGRALGSWEPLPEGRALLDHWLSHSQLGRAERLILETLYNVHPEHLPVEEVAVRTGYEVSGGGFRNALGKLRTLELIEGRGEVKASDEFFEEAVFA